MDRILIVDDDGDFLFPVSNVLKDEGYEVIAASNGKEAIKIFKYHSPDLVLLDIKLPDMNGIKMLEEIKNIEKDLIVIMITGYGGIDEAVKAMKLGAFDFLRKPFDNRELVMRVKKALQTRYLSREVESLKKRLAEKKAIKEVMGDSPQIKRVFNQVEIVAPTDLTVIIQGESGTGKELVAQMIHQLSKRKDKPFVEIDCGAIPETLAESELFGYEKGAFTGSDTRKEGRFERANEGTLLLDEITNLTDAVQMKLLRVIQERKLQPLGGKKEKKIDVRIIVASNIDLNEAVKNGKFRNDLFHRLNEFHILHPPLRERKEDIPILINYFLKESNYELKKKIKGFVPKFMEILFNYHWPGNIRELKNFVKKAVLLTDNDYISQASLPPDIIKLQEEINSGQPLIKEGSFEEMTWKFERDLIQNALTKAGNNKTKAAKILKMYRKALYRKMKRLGL